MKKIKYILIASLMMLGSFSCNETEWLKEEPLSFYTTENSYTTVSQFRQALNYLYNQVCSTYWNIGDQTYILNFADLAHGGTDMEPVPTKFNNAQTWLVPTNYVVESYWNIAYLSIGNANTIINRIQSSALSDADKAGIEGEALFFRAYWFNFLANLYGGVPVPTEETTAPRTDYVTTPRAGVYGQARTDLERAVTLLSDITVTDDGKISIQAAQHLLAEVYISCGEYDKAIAAASAVINHPSMGLMTSRFGTAANKQGDPYWDLLQYNNQNRSTGNREAILVLQYDYRNTGSPLSCQMPRNAFPYIQGLQVARTGGGVVAPILSISNSTPENLGGRGIGVFHPTDYFLYDIWGADGTNDYRNSPQIILRDIRIDNPAAEGYGKWLVADGYLEERFKLRNFYPILLKFARTYDLPDDCYVKNADGSIATNAGAVEGIPRQDLSYCSRVGSKGNDQKVRRSVLESAQAAEDGCTEQLIYLHMARLGLLRLVATRGEMFANYSRNLNITHFIRPRDDETLGVGNPRLGHDQLVERVAVKGGNPRQHGFRIFQRILRCIDKEKRTESSVAMLRA